MAEILAEDAGTPGIFQKTDLVTNPVSCAASAPFYLSSGCYAPAGKKIISGSLPALSLPSATDTQMQGSPSLFMIDSTIKDINSRSWEPLL